MTYKINYILEKYYENNAKELHNLTDQILFKLHFFDVNNDDFYSLANEIFVDALRRFKPEKQNFDKFLYFQLFNKFKTEMTRRNRQKRKVDKNAISIDACTEDEQLYIKNIISDNKTIEDIVFQEEEQYSDKMLNYLNKLSQTQKNVLKLISLKYQKNEIIEILHISQKDYEDCCNAIRSYKNIQVLM